MIELACCLFTHFALFCSLKYTSDIFEGKQCDSEHQTLHSEWKIAIFHEHIVENPKYGVPGTFFSREISPIFHRHFMQSVRLFFQVITPKSMCL